MAAKKRTTKPSRPAKVHGVKKPKPTAEQAGSAPPAVLVVNMIPRSLSNETNQDSEPFLAVNLADPEQIAASAFTPDPMGGPNAPIYVSTDGGNTWWLNSIVPSDSGSQTGTHDITLAFASAGGNLYSGILRDPTVDFERLRTADFTNPAPMQNIGDRSDNDQPFTQAITNAGKDRVYIGNNDFQAQPKTATVDVSVNAGAANPAFNSVRVESRSTAGQNGPQIRPVAHPSGKAYAAFYGWRSQTGSFPGNTLVVTTDVVVVRDDQGGSGANAFQDLTDPTDGLPGRLVAQNVALPFHQSGTTASGQQRLGGTLSIAVDPRPDQDQTVYLAWGDQQPQSTFTLHIRSSTDGGVTWSPADLLTVPNALNAALAINSEGIIGLLYQQLMGSGASSRWVTHFRSTTNGVNWNDLVLATTPAQVPAKSFDPYLGDYDHLVAVGRDFFGIFSANNTPNQANFPNGVRYQRNVDFQHHTLLGTDNTSPVAASIDPFFFKVSG